MAKPTSHLRPHELEHAIWELSDVAQHLIDDDPPAARRLAEQLRELAAPFVPLLPLEGVPETGRRRRVTAAGAAVAEVIELGGVRKRGPYRPRAGSTAAAPAPLGAPATEGQPPARRTRRPRAPAPVLVES